MFSKLYPCALCKRRLVNAVKTHNQRLIDYQRKIDMDAYVQKRRLSRLKYHYYNSSESQHQLNEKVFKLNSLSSVDSKTYFHPWPPQINLFYFWTHSQNRECPLNLHPFSQSWVPDFMCSVPYLSWQICVQLSDVPHPKVHVFDAYFVAVLVLSVHGILPCVHSPRCHSHPYFLSSSVL